ncbi:MAG: YfiR family protein [Terracidiphilus sp.]
MKAAFLFHFAQLVEWPEDAFEGNAGSLVLCTLEDDAFYDELENTIQGKQIGSRIIRIRHIHLSQAVRGCNLLFIGKSEGKSLSLSILRNLPVLTVGEADDFLTSGGMIRFHFEQDKMRFDINSAAADSSHLKISSRLLLLATSVTRSGGMEQGR